MKPTSLFTFAIAPLLLAGCAVNRPNLKEKTTTTSTNGVVTVQERSLQVLTAAFWPAQNEVSKQKATLGKTMSTGTDSLDQQSGGTNVVDALKHIDSILGKVR